MLNVSNELEFFNGKQNHLELHKGFDGMFESMYDIVKYTVVYVWKGAWIRTSNNLSALN